MTATDAPQPGMLVLPLDSWDDLSQYPDREYYRSALGTPVVIFPEGAPDIPARAIRYPTPGQIAVAFAEALTNGRTA